MPRLEQTDPWVNLRAVVDAIANGLTTGRSLELALMTLQQRLGARSAWSTLELTGQGPVQRAETSSFHRVPPAVVAEHVMKTLEQVKADGRAIADRLPYDPVGSFTAVPLWSPTPSPRVNPRLTGVIYLDFPEDEGIRSDVIEFLDYVAMLLGAVVTQQTSAERAREHLREQRVMHQPGDHLSLDDLLGSANMTEIREEIRVAIRSKSSILILGESGTGKTQLATAVAAASNLRPIVRATLGFSDDLNTITSELFGHERGAFSGAVSRRKGLVEHADRGTLILDEVLNLSKHAQQLLLDFTQFGTYRPLGYQGRDPKRAEVRLIAVTNGDIERAVMDTRFRQDLYFRLATVPIRLPPLRARRDDIPDIARRYLRRIDPYKAWRFESDAFELLSAPHLEWAGNVRELEAVLQRAHNRATADGHDADTIEARHLDLPPKAGASRAPAPTVAPTAAQTNGAPLRELHERWQQLGEQRAKLDSMERQIITDALARCGGVVSRTARELSLPRTTLISRMATLDIDANEPQSEQAR